MIRSFLLTVIRLWNYYHKIIILIIILLILFSKEILCYFDIYSNGITALSYLIGAIIAILGLDAWKTNRRGKWDIDIARQYLKIILQLRDALKFVRNPFISLGEMQSALEKSGFNPEDYEDKKKMNKAVYSTRWNKVQEKWTDLEATLVDAETLWGPDAVNAQKNLDDLVRKLRSAIWLFINYPENVKFNDENFKLIYGTYDENDKFSIAIDEEIKKIRNFLKDYF